MPAPPFMRDGTCTAHNAAQVCAYDLRKLDFCEQHHLDFSRRAQSTWRDSLAVLWRIYLYCLAHAHDSKRVQAVTFVQEPVDGRVGRVFDKTRSAASTSAQSNVVPPQLISIT